MQQRQAHHFGSSAVLVSIVAFALGFVGAAPRASHAQNKCSTELHEATVGTAKNSETLCQTAVNGKCAFQLALCVNQGTGCTPTDLKTKKIKATGHCGPVAKINVKPNGTAALCGTPATLKVKTTKRKTRKGTCKLRVMAGRGNVSKFNLDCQPQAGLCPTTTTTTFSGSTTTTSTIPPVSCTTATRLSFTTGLGSGNCGTILNAAGTVTKNLACGGLYTGGGQNSVPLPYAVPDMGQSLTGISGFNAGTRVLTFTNLTSAQTGSIRNCTSVNCLFGPPLPIPNSITPATSVCVVNSVATDATGTANCDTGVSNLNLPLTSTLYLTGDVLPGVAGVQPCPLCTGGTCQGGPNNGLACTPGASPATASFPTSHDCPPSPGTNIGGLPIAFALTTGTMTRTAVNNPASGQNNVFCGYCKDLNAAATGCFEGDPDSGCPHNGACVGAGNPYLCCSGAAAGTCDQAAPKVCASNADCTDGSGSWPDCLQRDPGAFGPAGGGAHTITETGAPAGNLNDGLGHASTLVSIFCIRPTFNATVDAAGDLPGPGAVSLVGTAQLQ